jgi:uncharacterized protein (TIGR00369 family)
VVPVPVANPAEITSFLETFPGGVPWSIVGIDNSSVTIELSEEWVSLRPGGSVSGPTLMMLADSAAYAVVLGFVGLNALAVTSNLNIDFLRRPWPGAMRAVGRPLKLGRSLIVSSVEMYSVGRDELVAHATVTYSMALVTGS